MSFSDLTKKLKKLNLPLGQYVLVGSAPLAVRGLREAKDLDIVCDENLRKKLASKYPTKIEDGVKKAVIGEDIELILEGDSIYDDSTIAPLEEMIKTADVVDGVPYLNLELTKAFKRKMGRPKDLNDIALIDQFL